jgi:hypothetical protein
MQNPPTIEDAMTFHFGGADATPGWVVRSSLMALLAHARSETGRDPYTGELADEEGSGSWLGATAYLILLDQIGKCFKPANAPNPAGPSSVERALQMWSSRSRPEVCVLTALRNSLAHDFALSNRNNKDSDYQHRFALDRDPTRLVELPAERWTGDYQSTKQDTTIVSLRALGDLVETVVAKVKKEAAAANIEITLAGGPTELIYRYGVLHRA